MADPYETNEVRWFFPGEMPLAVTDWFIGDLPGHCRDELPVREDLYLLLPGRDDIGLKFRDDQIQVKLRCDHRPFSALDGRVAGVATAWARYAWRYDRSACDPAQAFSGSIRQGRRVTVAKTRRRKSYSLGSEGRPHPLADGERTAAPILIEVTEIAFAGLSAWSLGIDAVGPESAAPPCRLEAAAWLLQDCPALPLERPDSLDYPAFITRQTEPLGATIG